MVCGFVQYQEKSNRQNVNGLNQNAFRISEDDDITQKLAYDTLQFEDRLVVSNGTPCDHIYEILDSFMIYPALVTAVLGQAKRATNRDLYDKKELKKSYLLDKIGNFKIEEYKLGSMNQEYKNRLIMALEDIVSEIVTEAKDEEEEYAGKLRMKEEAEKLVAALKSEKSNDQRSIFELPLVMKASVPAEKYFEKNMKVMLNSMFEVLRAYIRRFVKDVEFNSEYGNLLVEQYMKLLQNVTIEGENFPLRDIYRDSIFVYTSGAIQRELENIDLREEAGIVENITYKLLKR